ncbi:PQQ-dependent sugar dehydrogenase [Photobacterium minamisatsumaniensis]|uniref:PQQ-dependent sugar dehydrogenase n=1 Tax=Photobacterium minamisatsumaniensis TaxID=2910233 RepID=UPI003D0C0F16
MIPRALRQLVFICVICLNVTANAKSVYQGSSQGMPFQVDQISTLSGTPWGMTFISDNTLFITLRDGRAVTLNTKSTQVQAISGLPNVFASGQGGLLDVNYHPSGWLYFTYSKPVGSKAATTLARAKLVNTELKEWEDLLVTKSTSDTARHFGSRIAFKGEFVFFSVGDRGHRPNGQDLTTHAGSIIRLTLNGKVPADNPFVKQSKALPEIWSYGHRNPQGLLYDSHTNRLWSNEHGPRGGDEINLITKGSNYGWPITSHGKEYWGPITVGEAKEKEGIVSPKKVYIPSIAPGSLLLYNGDAFPVWKGSLFSGALKLRHLNRTTMNTEGSIVSEERLLESLDERIRALTLDPKGFLYLSTDSGDIYRLTPH